VAAGAAAAAFFGGLAALHAAAAMRVLARDRRIPPPLPLRCVGCAARFWPPWDLRSVGWRKVLTFRRASCRLPLR
jgi:hypothetical protein